MGTDRTFYFHLSSLERGKDMIFLWMWDGALKCHLQFLLWSKVTKGLNFMLDEGTWAMATPQKGRAASYNFLTCNYMCKCLPLFYLLAVLNLLCPSLSLANFSDLKSILTHLSTATPALFWLLFMWILFSHSFMFKFFVSLDLNWVSCK